MSCRTHACTVLVDCGAFRGCFGVELGKERAIARCSRRACLFRPCALLLEIVCTHVGECEKFVKTSIGDVVWMQKELLLLVAMGETPAAHAQS